MMLEKPENLAETLAKSSEALKICPECGLELAGENAVCACEESISAKLKSKLAQDPFVGSVLNKNYKIEEVIGRGGMGSVYKARDMLMERTVAVKMLHAHLVADQSSIQRFQQEARAASAINHPNVITAYDFGVSEAGQPFLIMDFLQGKSLSAIIGETNGLPCSRAIHIFAQTCDALHVAHSKGVIHRDLKPSNIMIVQSREDSDFVKIVDFGIAKLLPQSGKQSHNLTQTGELFGSPLYMSPEQFLGKVLDVRTDVYAMGCVMYETLIGHPPFSGEHVLETMHQHLNEEPPKFNVARPDLKIPERLQLIVMRALEKEPDARFQTMSEMRDAVLLSIEGAKDTRSLNARLQSIRSQLKRARKKNEKWLRAAKYAGLAFLAAAFVAAGVLFIMQGDRDSQWIRLRREAHESYRRGDLEQAEKQFLLTVKNARELYGKDSPKYQDSLEKLAWICEEKGEYARARKFFQIIKGFSNQDMNGFRNAQIFAYSPVSQLENLQSQNVTAGPESALKASIKELERFIGPADPGLLVLYETLAKTYEKQKHFAEAEDARIKIVSIREDSQGQDSMGAAEAKMNLGNMYIEWGKDSAGNKENDEARRQYELSKESFEAAAKICKSLGGNASKSLPEINKAISECTRLKDELQGISSLRKQ